jgi:glucosylglycerol-phosphate synthase
MLLATDLDGTLLAGDHKLRRQLYKLLELHPEFQLAYVTGRGLESVLPLLSDPLLPQPEYIICDVGATVVDGKTHQPIQPLQSDIEQRWPGEQAVATAMAPFKQLKRQEVPQQRRCSYHARKDDLSPDIDSVADGLECDVIYSADWYLDIMPRGVNKGSTIRALVELLGIDPQSVLVAGDTLNDLSMFEQGFKGVCVGRSEPALVDATSSHSNVMHAAKSGCGGILEALSYFGFLGPKGINAELPEDQSPGKADTVIVYHRLPYDEIIENGRVRRQRPRSPNGIIPTLLSFFGRERKGSWVAWSTHDPKLGEFETHTAVDLEKYPDLTCSRVPMSKHEVDIFYKRFSKEAFWPMLHTFWERARFREEHWQLYLEINRRFAEHAAAEAAEGALVWIHDYNLWMVPAFLREMRPDLRIAFFHHTHFPSADVFNVVPWRREIISSLLQCNYVGFHIPRQAENFVDVARGVTPLKVLEKRRCAPRFLTYGCALGLDLVTTALEVNGRRIELGTHPVGLDVERVKHSLALPQTRKRIDELREELADHRVILSVERLDYTKGSLEKLLAFERLLEQHPELQGQVSLLTVCVPAAKEMTIYSKLQTQIEQAVGRINGRYSKVGYVPVQFFFRALPFEELVAYYAVADVMWVTPLRDGLNLVAKEFIATQGLTEGHGTLVLSEFAGVAVELRGAILTNPYDRVDLVQKCYQGIVMEQAEAEGRLREMFEIVKHNDIGHWGREFIRQIRDVRQSPKATKPDSSAA